MFFRYRTDAAPAANTVYPDGKRARRSPPAYFYTGALGQLGEYTISRNEVTRNGVTAQLDHTTWEATGSYFLKVSMNYERTSFTGGAATGDREPENALIGRFQTSF